jgi:phosphatidylglycerol lysyltransferase
MSRAFLNPTRSLIAFAVAVMGVIDVWSALLSHPPERLVSLRHWLPTTVIDTSRTFTLLAGALLLVTAWGLRRGKRRAFVGAIVLCAISVPVNVLKAVDVEEATAAAALMLLLALNSDAFRVRSRTWSLRDVNARALWTIVALVAYSLAGCWWLEWRYGPDASLAHAAAETLHRLFGFGEPALVLARDLPIAHRRIVEWYLRSLPVIGVTALTGFAVASLRPVVHRRQHRLDVTQVETLWREHGTSTVSAFALDEANDYFFSPTRRSVVAYRFESGVALGIGDPIGPVEERLPLLASFADDCQRNDWPFGLFQAQPEWLPLYEQLGWRAIHIGEDAILWTERFGLEGSAMGDVRRSVRRLTAAGFEALEFDPRSAAFDPARDPYGLYPQMEELSRGWLRAHVGGEKGFCMGRFTAARLNSDWLVVAWNPVTRRVEGFVTWVRIPARGGWALDLMRRHPQATPGVMEFLIARSVEMGRERGDALFSLSLSALASVAEGAPDASRRGPSTEAGRAREFLIAHLSRFYDFKGLFRWKQKFSPVFEDRFLVCGRAMDLPRVVLALVRAQSPGGLRGYFARPAEPVPPSRDTGSG